MRGPCACWLWQRRDHLSDFVVNDGSLQCSYHRPYGRRFVAKSVIRPHPLVSKSFEELFMPQNPQATTPSDDGCLLEVRKSPGAPQDLSLNGSSLVEGTRPPLPRCLDGKNPDGVGYDTNGNMWQKSWYHQQYHVTSCHMCGLPIDFCNQRCRQAVQRLCNIASYHNNAKKPSAVFWQDPCGSSTYYGDCPPGSTNSVQRCRQAVQHLRTLPQIIAT